MINLAIKAELATRLEKLKAKQYGKQLVEIEKMLDEAGVPEWVENSDSNGVPSNAPHCRLKWFLARRKNVTPWETDKKLSHEMQENLEYAKQYAKNIKPKIIK